MRQEENGSYLVKSLWFAHEAQIILIDALAVDETYKVQCGLNRFVLLEFRM